MFTSMLRVFSRRSIVALALFASCASILLAQTSTSIISGTVTDSSGAVVSGAQVQVKNVGTGISTSLTTNAQGRYRASELIIGDYEVSASQSGFQTVVRKGISTTVGGEAIVDITLAVGQSQQVVTVDAQVSQVDTTTSAISNTVTRTQIDELPLGARNQTDLIALAPGVGYSAPVGGANYGRQENYSISGGRANGIQFLIDNTNLATYTGHSTGSAATGQTLGLEALGDYQVLTNTYSAQFGGNGGIVNAASKSGTNSIHGSAYFYLRNTAILTARNTFDTFVRPGDTAAIAPPLHQGIFGGSLGGPIKKNKAFFFANYEGVRLGAENEVILAGVPDINAHKGLLPCAVATSKYACDRVSVDGTPGGYAFVGLPTLIAPIMALYPNGQTTAAGVGNYTAVSPRSSQDDYLLTRFDYTLSTKDSIFARYVRQTAIAQNIAPQAQSVPLTGEADRTANHFFTVEEDHVFSPTLINQARISFLRPFENAVTTTDPIPAIQAINTPGATQNTVTLGSKLTIGPANLVPYRQAEQTFQLMDDVIWTHGAHSVKFGGAASVVVDLTNQNSNGANWNFSSILSFMTASPTQVTSGVPGQLDNFRDSAQRQFMPYINDEWKISRKLTLNMGVRYEWLGNPGERHGRLSNVTDVATNSNWVTVPTVMPNNPSNKNFAPRVGFAYDPFPDHKTAIRGGFGMFYNELTAHIWLNNYWGTLPYQSVTVSNLTLLPTIFPNIFANGIPPGAVPQAVQFGLLYRNDTPLHTPYMMQYNLSIQREVAQGTIVSVAYVGSKGVHLIGDRDYNFPVQVNGLYGTALTNGTVQPNPRPNLNFGVLNLRNTDAYSNYHSLQTSVKRNFANHFQAQVSYTYSKTMDVGSGDAGPDNDATGSSQVVMNPLNTRQDYARANFDFTHVLKINGIYELPFTRNEFVKGWRLSAIVSAQSGNPFTVLDGFDQIGNGQTSKNSNARPNLNPACLAGGTQIIQSNVNQWYNPSCFTLGPAGSFGNVGRNTLVAPGLQNTNLAILKRTAIPKISEQFVLEFRGEVRDLLNHANYGLPNQALYNNGITRNTTAGQITTTNPLGNRTVQLALRATF
jgi:Carboxypeptidase regulatory-like domain/TonB dependent receptor